MGDIKQTPLRAREGSTLQLMHGMCQLMEDADVNCRDRLEACGRMRDFHRVRTQFNNILVDMMKTVPPEKMRMFIYNLEHQEMAIRTKSDGLSKDAGYLYVPVGSMMMLCAVAAKLKCTLCDGTNEDMRRCKLRKCLNDCTLVEFDGQFSGGCKWQGFDWEGAGDE